MKQSAAKTLGVAALGAAFAAAAAGTASATALPLGPDALGTVTSIVPLGEDVTDLPSGVAETLGAGQGALNLGAEQGIGTLPQITDQATKALPPVTEQATKVPMDGVQNGLAHTPAGQLTGLLGGLPVGGLTGGLPTGGLPTGGLGLPV
ncbi:hypothetical protein [Streptomyces showdoensis]|uniref:ATP-binding protein n=1 Tax=Streptomyces showdoensis TaxID=68268 RepID=A0A2P2GMZ1_STREW|nr:hypothetical protein [Streptomyces showdoensis]KKZ72854.1 hypothetical protein VO63_16065 [Streptomyces showdoensis]